jgi:hypothetical protein
MQRRKAVARTACRDAATRAQAAAGARDMIGAMAASVSCSHALALVAAVAALPSGCDPAKATANWQTVITRKDIQALRNWRTAWEDALTKARTAGKDGAIAAEGALVDPDAGLSEPSPPVGDYNCRTLRFGSGNDAPTGLVASPAETCRINALGSGILGFAKLRGTQRPIGRIYPGTGARLTFLGTLALGDETRPFGYGLDADRDLVGLVERIGPDRWRLAIPHPPFSSAFEVIELSPVSN